MPLTVQNVYGLLLRSRLLSMEDAKGLFLRWQKEAKDKADDLERFRRWLIGHHYLTEYQANLLCKGHADGFFIGDYKILERLGRGRMAGVYKGVHTGSGQVLAIKVLPPSRAKDGHMLGRFQREARLAIRLKNVNVVRTFQLGEATGVHYIVMEYLDGETLDEALQRRRRLGVGEAVRVVYQALLGLQHIHEQGMVHRDLKPSNLMLTPARQAGQPDNTLNATVKILDIGLGREFFDENSPVPREQDQLTGENVLLGTPDYLAPEQARDAKRVDIRADIYSLGCVLYHCLAGQTPFPDHNIITQMIRHAQEQPKPLREFNADVPDGLQQIVNWMLAKDPAQRYPTPERAAQAMQVFLAAGMEKVRQPPEDASMIQFLNWIEGRVNGTPPQPAAAAPPAPAAGIPVARGAVPPPSKTSGSRSGKKKHSKKSKKRRSKGMISLGSSKKREYDVELVPAVPSGIPIPPTPAQAPAPAPSGLSRRDLILLGAGAGSVLVTVAVAGVLASGGLTGFLRKLGLMSDDSKKDK